ncbi:MAG: hypothetical protein DRI40_07510 [Chloroflexi bacterium]|nr:MAG: hypothetical protein DRI40_07510 [Chloroflexota bacterium]
MPGFDGTGPRGMGPMTGGGRGFCSPWGIGAAFRAGMARPWPAQYLPYAGPGPVPYPGYAPGWQWSNPAMNPYAPQMTRQEELELLRSQAQTLGQQLQQIQQRLQELEQK